MSNTTMDRAPRCNSQATPSTEARLPTPQHSRCGTPLRSDKITEEHLQRLAIVYVRQSTQQQVLEHRESTARQYALADRAVALGWPAAAVEVIDEDQGHSGSSAEGRSGFQRLLAEVSSDRAGLILGLEMSRLARSCKDWHTLLEVCAIYRTLLGDTDGLYAPSQYNDRLLLGLKGTMSEAEKLPVRPHFGGNRGELEWRRPNRVTLLNVLHHPIYAGAYRWGHREADLRKKVPGRPATGRTLNAHNECRVLIRDRFPAYITWEEFESNQRKLAENSTLGTMLSAPRHGPSVLAGLVVCGRCGHRMLAGYANTTAKGSLRYSCLRDAIDYGTDPCQSLSGMRLESFVIERLLQAVSPASLELSLAATANIERERKQLDDHWQQRLARSHYEVEQARRQYAAVDPEHRLVARELERRWDEALRASRQLQADYVQFTRDCPAQLSPHEREPVLALAGDLPTLWHAESTTPQDRQMIARLLLEQVAVTIEGNTDRVDLELRWAGGFVSRHTLSRPVQTYKQLSNYDELVAGVDALRTQRKTLSEIAVMLNAEGFHPPKRARHFTKAILSGFLRERGVRTGALPRSVTAEHHLRSNEWWPADLAAELSMPIATLHRWQRVGWVSSRKVTAAGGRWAIYADADELLRFRRLRDSSRGWPQPYPTELITPKTKTEETGT